ncbi:MAG: hypothetical protein OSB43_10225 [Nocardioides sp.]|uniref:hypothetical protein n=1 Tax=Nocardioides sp. TaxID=35761 RepID=UPI00239F2793|nr:hypothetical protein [Nocardioides sp.]MDE0776637.1 hypothetical protein [Nocardioides sp.]
MTEQRGRPGPTAAEAGGWAAADLANASSREQLAYLLEQPELLATMHARFDNLDDPQQRGHYFEWMHELSFNLESIGHGATERLRMTEWLGRPHDPADLQLLDNAGNVLAEAQAKVVSGLVSRVGPSDGIAATKYDGMDLLVPSDHVEATKAFLHARMAMPTGPLHDRYQDVVDRITDTVRAGSIASDPVSTGHLSAVTDDPDGFLQRLVRDNELTQAMSGFLAAGGTAALGTAAVGIAIERVREGSFGNLPWTEISIRAARVGSAAAAVGAAGTFAATQAQEAVAAGSESVFATALGGSNIALALTRASLTVAGAAHGYATGRLTSKEAALITTEGVTRSAAVWAAAAVGQAVIPIPVVGAMIGGMFGQYGATVMVQGLQFALAARATSRQWDRAYDLLLAETDDVVRRFREERAELALLAGQYEVGFTRHVLPALDGVQAGLWTGDPDRVLGDLAALSRRYEGTPQFGSLAEFDAFMGDPMTSLVLNLGSGKLT